MVALSFAALWLGLIAPSSVPEAREAGGEVIANVLEVLDEPDGSSYLSGELKRGERVSILPGGKPGWLAIVPPSAAFDWVEASAIQAKSDGPGEVVAVRASVRTGCIDARIPGPPRPPLAKGAVVQLLDRPSLTLGKGPQAQSWRAIAPPPGEVRYVRADGIKIDRPEIQTKPTTVDAQVQPAQSRGDPDEAILKFEEALRRSRRIDHDVSVAQQKLRVARTISERGLRRQGITPSLVATGRRPEDPRPDRP